MRFLAAKRLGNHDANLLWEALIEGIRRVSAIRRLLGAPIREQVNWGELLSTAWISLRRATLKGVALTRLLGQPEGIGSNPSVIEAILPNLYCAPVPLLCEMAKRHAPALVVQFSENTFVDNAVVAQVRRQLLADSFRVLLENIAKYGRKETMKATCSLEVGEKHQLMLLIQFVDVRLPNVQAGGGDG